MSSRVATVAFILSVTLSSALLLTASTLLAAERSAPVTTIASDREVKRVKTRNAMLAGPTKFDTKADRLPSDVSSQYQLSRLAKALATSGSFEGLLAESSKGKGVIPTTFESIVATSFVKVESASGTDEALDLGEALTNLATMLADGGANSEVQIEQSNAWYDRDVFFTSAKFSSSTPTIRYDADWEIAWSPDKDGNPLIGKLKTSNWKRTTIVASDAGKLFTERTADALSGFELLSQLQSFDGDQVAGIWPRHSGFGRSGIAVGDANGDGLDDLFVPRAGGIPNRMFVRQQDGSLKEMGKDLGLDWLDESASGLFVDLDNDGDQDLVVSTATMTRVLSNEGESFVKKQDFDVVRAAVCAADYDGDGLLDLLLHDGMTNGSKKIEHPDDLAGDVRSGVMRLFRNQGELAFTDVSKEAGLGDSATGYAVAWLDHDQDGDPDLMVAQGTGLGGLYPNNDATFGKLVSVDSATSVSMAWGDLDRDGYEDAVVGNGWTGFFRDVIADSRAASVSRASGRNVLVMGGDDGFGRGSSFSTGWTNAVQMADLDNSGSLDLIALNGCVSRGDFKLQLPSDEDNEFTKAEAPKELLGLLQSRVAVLSETNKKRSLFEVSNLLREGRSLAGDQSNRVFLNTLNEDHLLADVSPLSGLDVAGDGRGLAMVDWDHDGDLDVWMSNRNAPTLQFFENVRGAENDAIQFQLIGKDCNRDAIGATVHVELESGAKLMRTVRAGQAYRSQSTKRVHFGIGKDDAVKSVAVLWPAPGKKETFEGVGTKGTYRLTQGVAAAELVESSAIPIPSGGKVASMDPPNAVHDLLLPVRPLFPNLYYLTSGMEETRRVDWKPGKPLLLVLWNPNCDVCVSEIKTLAKLRGMDCLALAPLGPVKDRRLPATLGRKNKFLNPEIDEAKGYHKVGFIEDDLLDELMLMHRHLFEQPYQLKVPCSFFLDREGRLAAVYRGGIDLKTVIGHFGKLKLRGRELVEAASPYGGSFAGELPTPELTTLIRDYLVSGQPQAAERVMTKLADDPEIKPVLLEMKSLLGEMYLMFGEQDRASELLHEFLAVHPDDPVALNNLGVLKAKSDDSEGAIAAWEKALKSNGKYPSALQNYATHLVQKKRYDDAEPITERLLAISPNSINVHNLMAIIFLQKGNFSKAESHLKTIIAIEPKAFGAYANLAKALASQNKREEAKRVLQKGLAVEGIDDRSKRGLLALLDRM